GFSRPDRWARSLLLLEARRAERAVLARSRRRIRRAAAAASAGADPQLGNHGEKDQAVPRSRRDELGSGSSGARREQRDDRVPSSGREDGAPRSVRVGYLERARVAERDVARGAG